MSAELVPINNDITAHEQQFAQFLETARSTIAQLSDYDALRDIANRAFASAEYFKRAKETRHLADDATEVRVWAERRVGEILLQQAQEEVDVPQIKKQFGTNPQTVRRWLNMARADESAVADVLGELKRTDSGITVGGVARRLQTKNLERVERGIYRNYLGQYVLRWRRDGVSRQLTLGSDLRKAREHLLVVTGKASGTPRTPTREWSAKELISGAYGNVRRMHQDLEKAHTLSTGHARSRLEEAIASLYFVEDALAAFLREPK